MKTTKNQMSGMYFVLKIEKKKIQASPKLNIFEKKNRPCSTFL